MSSRISRGLDQFNSRTETPWNRAQACRIDQDSLKLTDQARIQQGYKLPFLTRSLLLGT